MAAISAGPATEAHNVRQPRSVRVTSHFSACLIICVALGAPVATSGTPVRDLRRCDIIPPPPPNGFDPVALVRSAEVILLVRADSAKPFTDRPILGPRDSVYFTVLEVIDSGRTAPPATVAAVGRLSGNPDFNTGAVPHRWTRSDGLSGSCYAYTYQQGGEFLLLLKRERQGGGLTPYWAGLRPTNEQVRGSTDAWVTWVRAHRPHRRT